MMAHPYGVQGARAGTIVRGALVALVAVLLLLLGAPTQEAEAQSGDAPTVERVSPPDHELVLEIGQTQEFTAEVNSIYDDIIVWTATVDDWSEQFLFDEPGRSHEASFSHTFNEAGVFAVGIRFTGLDSGKLTASWQVTVVKDSSLPPNSAPVISGWAPKLVVERIEGSEQTLIAHARDDDANLTSAKWLLDGESSGEGDETYDNVSEAESRFDHIFSTKGTYKVTVVFIDSREEWVSLTFTVIISPPPATPPSLQRVACVPSEVEPSEPVTCSATLNGGQVSTYAWSAPGGNPSSGAGETFTTSWDSTGNRQVSLEVCNDGGCDDESLAISVAAGTITAPPRSPPAIDALECSPANPEVNETVTCSATLSGGSVSTYQWTAQNGNPSSGADRTFTSNWSSAGAKQVSLEACNDAGCDSADQTVTVDDPGATPTTTTTPPTNGTTETTGATPTVTTTLPTNGTTETTGGAPTVTVRAPPEVSALSLQTPEELNGLEAGSTYEFIAKGTDVNADIVSHEWYVASEFSTYQNKVEFGPSSLVESTLSYRIPKAGPYVIRVYFVDSKYGSGTTEWSFTATDHAPKVEALTCTPDSPEVGDVVRCSPTLSGGPPREEFWLAYDSVGQWISGQDYLMTWNTPGDKQVTLVVCNRSLQCGYQTHAILVLPKTSPPIIDSVGCDQDVIHVRENLRCTPQISGGPPVEYSWTAQHGFPPTGKSETFAPDWSVRGERAVTLKVCNRIEECDTSSQTVTVGHPIPPPVIESLGCRPLTVDIEDEVECEARLAEAQDVYYIWSVSSDDDARYRWLDEDLSVRWYAPGRERIKLEVCNVEDECDTERQTISVRRDRGSSSQINDLGCPIGTVDINQYVTCNPDVSAGGQVDYDWTAYSGSPRTGRSRSFQTRWSVPGIKTINLRVCEGNECVDAQRNMEVVEPATVNRPPVVTRISPGSPITVVVGGNYIFVAHATDPDGDLRSVGWQVSQRSTPANPPQASLASPTQPYDHVFDSPGHYQVSVAYYDSAGLSSVAVWEVTAVVNPSIPVTALQPINESLLEVQDIKREWLACVAENPDNETLCLSEMEDVSSARFAAANLSSIFDQYQEEALGEDFIQNVETMLRAASIVQGEAREASLLILQGALCGQACLELEVDGSESPWYLVGWLLVGFTPVVDIVADGRDVLASGYGCTTGLLNLDGCDWVDLGINTVGFGSSFVPIGVAQVGNIPQAGLHISKYVLRAPRATGKTLRAATRIPLLGEPLDKGVRFAVNKFFNKNTAAKVEFIGEFAGKKGDLYELVRTDLSVLSRDGIRAKHFRNGDLSEGKGLFDDRFFSDPPLNRLVEEANLVHPRVQEASEGRPVRLQWIVDAGEQIGVARVGKDGEYFPTSVYTVITELDGSVVTAFPGIPETLIGHKFNFDLFLSGGN